MGFPCGSVEKNPAANAGEAGLIPGFGKIPLEEEMTSHSSILARRGAWRARVHGVKKESDTTERLNNIMGLKMPGKETYLLGVIIVEREQAVARLVLQTLMVKVQGSRTQGCKSSQEMVQGRVALVCRVTKFKEKESGFHLEGSDPLAEPGSGWAGLMTCFQHKPERRASRMIP